MRKSLPKMTNEDGVTTWTGAYQPFGEMITGSGNVHGFTGKELDSEMGLNYFCQRYYDPQIGRFMTLDPFGGYIELPQTQMRYGYCMNNPLKYIDPLGLNPPMEWLWDENIAWTCYDDICIGVWTPPPIPPLHRDPDASSDEGLIGADEDAYSDHYGGGTGGYLGGRRRRSGYNPYGGGGEPGHSGSLVYTKTDEFQRIINAYVSWWRVNYAKHQTTANPVYGTLNLVRGTDYWACADWSDALKDFLQGIDLRYYTIRQLNSPYDVPFPLFHSWIVLSSESGFIWLDPWFFGLYFGVEYNGD